MSGLARHLILVGVNIWYIMWHHILQTHAFNDLQILRNLSSIHVHWFILLSPFFLNQFIFNWSQISRIDRWRLGLIYLVIILGVLDFLDIRAALLHWLAFIYRVKNQRDAILNPLKLIFKSLIYVCLLFDHLINLSLHGCNNLLLREMRTLLNRLQRGIPGPHPLLGPIDSLDTHNGMTRIVDVCLLITFEVLTGFKGLVRQSLGFFILIFEKIFNFFYVFLQVLDLIGDHPDTSSKLILTSTAIILQIFQFIACILDNM